MEHESDVKKILDKTDDGLKVFVHYLGKNCQNKTFRNPYRDDDRPSCRLYYHLCRGGGGKWYFHDYGNSDWHGDCFWFVMLASCRVPMSSVPVTFLRARMFPPKDTVYITGGEKDVLSLLSHGFDAVCFNSETANISDFVMQRLTHSYRHVVFLYDCDETGLKESKAREEQFQSRHPNVSRVVLPLKGTKQEKDISDFFKCGHSPDELVELTHEAQTSASNKSEQEKYEEINDEHSHTSEQARKCFRL